MLNIRKNFRLLLGTAYLWEIIYSRSIQIGSLEPTFQGIPDLMIEHISLYNMTIYCQLYHRFKIHIYICIYIYMYYSFKKIPVMKDRILNVAGNEKSQENKKSYLKQVRQKW